MSLEEIFEQILRTDIEKSPDGAEVSVLGRLASGQLTLFSFTSNQISRAVRLVDIEEIWCFIKGEGLFWIEIDNQSKILEIKPGLTVTLPKGAAFQCKNLGRGPIIAIASVFPAWPGSSAIHAIDGPWVQVKK
jgi:mannose-6-phosphate isomerase-like protein (cupin superfamily)